MTAETIDTQRDLKVHSGCLITSSPSKDAQLCLGEYGWAMIWRIAPASLYNGQTPSISPNVSGSNFYSVVGMERNMLPPPDPPWIVRSLTRCRSDRPLVLADRRIIYLGGYSRKQKWVDLIPIARTTDLLFDLLSRL